MPRANHKGRSSTGGRFLQLHHFMMETEAWRALSAQERVVYLEVALTYNGSNNGFLACSVRHLAERANINKDTASRALQRLKDLGFLQRATKGSWDQKTPYASEWRLTLYRCDRTGELPTKAFLKWRPDTETPVRNEGQHVRNEGTVATLDPRKRPKSRDRLTPNGEDVGPLSSDTYTSSHRRGAA